MKVFSDELIRRLIVRYENDNELQEVLYDLLSLRRASKYFLAEQWHNIRYSNSHTHLNVHVGKMGCDWWQCEERHTTIRVSRQYSQKPIFLCAAHEAEGETAGLWVPKDQDKVTLR